MKQETDHTENTYVVIPTYNEEKTVLKKVLCTLNNKGYRIILVDDGSVNKIQQDIDLSNVHVLYHKINLGQGAALQTGTTYALQNGADYIVHFDADGQHLAKDICDLLLPLKTNKADVVFGSRFLDKTTEMPVNKRFLLQIARYINYLFTGILLTDAHNGLRALTAKAARQIIITENRMAHASEILFLVKKKKLRFTEIAVNIRYTSYSKKKGQSVWNSIRIFFDLLLHKLFE